MVMSGRHVSARRTCRDRGAATVSSAPVDVFHSPPPSAGDAGGSVDQREARSSLKIGQAAALLRLCDAKLRCGRVDSASVDYGEEGDKSFELVGHGGSGVSGGIAARLKDVSTMIASIASRSDQLTLGS